MLLNRRKLKKTGLKFNPRLALIGLRITRPRITDFTNKKFTDSKIWITLHIERITSPSLEENIAISIISRNLHRKQGLYSFFFLIYEQCMSETLICWHYSCIFTLEDNCRHLFQITFRRIILFIPIIQGPLTKYTLSMKELIIDVSQLATYLFIYLVTHKTLYNMNKSC